MEVGWRALSHTAAGGVGAGRRRADPTFGGTGFRSSAQRLAKQKCVQPVEQTGAHNGTAGETEVWESELAGLPILAFEGSPAMVPAGAQLHRYGGNRAPTQRGKWSLSEWLKLPNTPRHAVFPKRASVAPETRRGTGWPRALATSPQALRVRRCVPSKGAGGRGGGSGRRPSWLGASPFSMAFRAKQRVL